MTAARDTFNVQHRRYIARGVGWVWTLFLWLLLNYY